MKVRARALGVVLAGALMLLWPAFLNLYPLVFSDTGAFLAQTVEPLMIWDKPWIYGPLVLLGHWHVTLWGTALGQALIVSHLLWLVQRAVREASPAAHLALCAAAALLTTGPWVVSLIMPDVLVVAVVLGAFLLGFARERLGRGELAYLNLLVALSIAAHLSHLPLAAALVVLALLVARSWRATLRVAAPMAAALALLLVTNLAGHGRLAVSPYGASFLLARLVADGPAARTIEEECPQRGWYLCAWAGRLPDNSDWFLWDPESPVNRDAEGRSRFLGGMLLAPEAGEIIRETLRRRPLEVAADAVRNAASQLFKVRIGDVLGAVNVGASVRPRLVQGFPESEVARFDAALQQRDELLPVAERIGWIHPLVLALSVPLALLALRQAAREGDLVRLGLVLCVLLGMAGNAAVTGALSMPHHRYQARIAWLLPLLVPLVLPPRRRSMVPAVTPAA
jgi:hypothetical protein